MPRPALGQAAKSKVASVRVTPTEEAALKATFGSVSKALRRFVDQTTEAHLKQGRT